MRVYGRWCTRRVSVCVGQSSLGPSSRLLCEERRRERGEKEHSQALHRDCQCSLISLKVSSTAASAYRLAHAAFLVLALAPSLDDHLRDHYWSSQWWLCAVLCALCTATTLKYRSSTVVGWSTSTDDHGAISSPGLIIVPNCNYATANKLLVTLHTKLLVNVLHSLSSSFPIRSVCPAANTSSKWHWSTK